MNRTDLARLLLAFDWLPRSGVVLLALPAAVLACDNKSHAYATEFSTKALVPTTGTLSGGRAYTVHLPAGLVKGDDELGGHHYGPPPTDSHFTYGPKMDVRYVPGQPKVSSLSSAFGSPAVTHTEENAAGARVTLVGEAKASFIVRVAKTVGNGYLQCEFAQELPKGQKDFEALVAFGEQVCATLAPNAPMTTGATVSGAGEAPVPSAEAPPAATPEMQQFMSSFGSGASVKRALTKHGRKALDTKDMQLYELAAPKIVAGTTSGARTCYTIDASAGMTTRTYSVCWEKGKIVEIEDKGMR